MNWELKSAAWPKNCCEILHAKIYLSLGQCNTSSEMGFYQKLLKHKSLKIVFKSSQFDCYFLSNLLQNQSGNSDVLLKCFLESFFNFIGLVTIWTVHLDVRLTVQVQSFLRIRRSVWTTTTTTVVVRTLLCCGNSHSLQSRQGIKFTGTAWSEISVLRSLNMLDVIGICQNWANALWTTEARSRLTKLCDITQLLIFSKSFFVKSFLGLVFAGSRDAGSNRNESN